MQIIEVQFAPWDQSYFFLPQDEAGSSLDLKIGDSVIAETSLGVDLGTVAEIGELYELPPKADQIKPVKRKATDEDRLIFFELNKNKGGFCQIARELIKKHQLAMKFIDAYISFDDQRLTLAFIADGRIDFRELVKELGRAARKNVRLHQIGVRDEAKFKGDFGPCGRPLCCQAHLKVLGNVSNEFAQFQQVAHRGSDRLSGVCNRLKCCLRFEQPVYEEMAKGFPKIGSRLKTQYGEGEVIAWYPLKGKVGVNIGTEERPEMVEVEAR